MVPVGDIFRSPARHRQVVPEFDRAARPGNLGIGIVAVGTVCPFKARINEIFRVAEHSFITKVKEYFLIHSECSI